MAIQRIDSLIAEAMEQEMMKHRQNQPPPQQPIMTGVLQHASVPLSMSLPGIVSSDLISA